jgi:predicted DCC family thiol-disulfide oxidoreductase YuxK
MGESSDHPLILFDGACNLCSASVNFVIDRDPAAHFRFAPLQSPIGQAMLRRHALPPRYANSVVLIEDGRALTLSTASLHIARRLRRPWPLLFLLTMIPAGVRDAAYEFVAANRYNWFGRTDACRMPTPERQARFVA